MSANDSYDGQATIRQNDREVRAHVEYEIEQDDIYVGPDSTIGGMKTWSGTIQPESPLELGNATLTLPHGSSGTIIVHATEVIDATTYGDSWKRAILGATANFTGTGPAPRRSSA
jgi:hypothetical protein